MFLWFRILAKGIKTGLGFVTFEDVFTPLQSRMAALFC